MNTEAEPLFSSWLDYVNRTTRRDRMERCNAASKRANRVHRCLWPRKIRKNDFSYLWFKENISGHCHCCGVLPGSPCKGAYHLRGIDVWNLMETAKGRCMYCSSLAVERRPSVVGKGHALPWAKVGRRIGSLEHIQPFIDGRRNHLSNLGWSCLWCNVHVSQRIPFALDHGGFYPSEP